MGSNDPNAKPGAPSSPPQDTNAAKPADDGGWGSGWDSPASSGGAPGVSGGDGWGDLAGGSLGGDLGAGAGGDNGWGDLGGSDWGSAPTAAFDVTAMGTAAPESSGGAPGIGASKPADDGGWGAPGLSASGSDAKPADDGGWGAPGLSDGGWGSPPSDAPPGLTGNAPPEPAASANAEEAAPGEEEKPPVDDWSTAAEKTTHDLSEFGDPNPEQTGPQIGDVLPTNNDSPWGNPATAPLDDTPAPRTGRVKTVLEANADDLIAQALAEQSKGANPYDLAGAKRPEAQDDAKPGGDWPTPQGNASAAPPPGGPPSGAAAAATAAAGAAAAGAKARNLPATTADPDAPLTPQEIEDGKLMAILAHGGNCIGIPLFAIPLIQQENAFAVYHAKQAAAGFVVFYAALTAFSAIGAVTCGIGFILYLALPAIGVYGAYLAQEGRQEPFPVVGDLAIDLLKGIQAKRPKQLKP